MTRKLNGKIDGKHIELERDAGLPAGTRVSVQIESEDCTTSSGAEGIMALAGIWKDDSEIARIFDDILQEREQRPYRDVDFDAPS